MENTRLTEKLFGSATPSKASGLAFSIATLLPTALSLVFLIVVAAFGLDANPEYTNSDWYLYANYILPQLSFALVAVWFCRYRRFTVKDFWKSQKCSPIYFLIAVLLQVGLFSLSELNGLFLRFLERFGYEDRGINLPSMSGIGFIGVLFTVAVLPAIFEEVLFRGLLLNGVKDFGTVRAVLLCGALFSLYHQNPAQTVYQFCCGAAFALVALRSGSILPTVVSHFINNAVIIILTKFGVSSFPTPVFVGILVVSGLCLCFSLWFLICKDTARNEGQRQSAEVKSFFTYAAVGIAVCAFTWLAVLMSGM